MSPDTKALLRLPQFWVLAFFLLIGAVCLVGTIAMGATTGQSDYCDTAVAGGLYGAEDQGTEAAIDVCNDTSYLDE